ncbi:hypothetical protein LWF01_14850 [Saxibacter everestensis]|uniref:Fibronectin type-III domain-containing protein n=1 Tax=Saxibacter everestensis TaxID=2909229 RepID=A0ABY8QQT6_9MICO|nr:hypothetical protein LWF01_14850 [Brevibacteriaceae bacterium ZFBP1038]
MLAGGLPAMAATPGENPDGSRLVTDGTKVSIVAGQTVLTTTTVPEGEADLKVVSYLGAPAVMYAEADDTTDPLPAISSVASAEAVRLFWEDVTHKTEPFTVTRNDEVIGTTSDLNFTDTTAVAGVEYDYVVTTASTDDYEAPEDVGTGVEAPEGPVSSPQDPVVAEPPIIWLPQPETEVPEIIESQVEPDNEPGPISIGVLASRLSAAKGAAEQFVSAAKAKSTSKATLRYTTFISSKTVKTFMCELKDRRYGGDDRGYSATARSYRTRVQVNATFGKSASVTAGKRVQDTHSYNTSGKLVGTRNAGSKGIKVLVKSRSATRAKVRINHSVGNPFCYTGAIKYNMDVTLSKYGGYKVAGSHRQAPHHEVYRSRDDGPFYFVYKKAAKSFTCLVAGACKSAKVNKSTL